jgi:hypothetical protein
MIREGSPILRQMLDKHEIGLVGGIYDLSTVKFISSINKCVNNAYLTNL